MKSEHLSTTLEPSVRRQFWQKPRLRTDDSDERSVGRLELFYDLVFVVVISQLAHHLSQHLDAQGVWQFVMTFVPVWWVWISGTYYTERFETPDISFRLFTFLQMLPVAGMALTVADAFDGRWTGFATSYILARLITIFLWWRAARHDPSFAPTAVRFNMGFVTSVVLWSISLFSSLEVSVLLAGAGLIFDLVAPWTTLEQQSRLPRISRSHMNERYSLFVIIVLGEAIIGVVSGVAERKELELSVLVEGGIGMLLVFSLWWLYFDFVGRRSPKPVFRMALFWSYLHLPLVIGISALSAGLLNAIADAGALGNESRWLLTSAIALSLIVIGTLEYTLERDPHEPTHEHISSVLKFAGAIVVVLIGAFSSGMSPMVLMSLLFASLLVQITYGVWVWLTRTPDSLGAPKANFD